MNPMLPLALFAISLPAWTVALASESADTALAAYYRTYLEEEFRLHPTMATDLGDHRFDGALDDVSASSRDHWLDHTRATLADLPKQIDYASLSRAAQIDYDMFRDDLARSLYLHETEHPYEEDPRVYVDLITDSVYRLFMQSTVPKETSVHNAILRMRLDPAVLAIAQTTLTHPPRVLAETASKQNQGAITFFNQELFELIGDTPQLVELKAAATAVVAALRAHQQFLDNDLLPRATGTWRIGPQRYATKLEMVLDAGVTADQMVVDAKVEFERIRRDMAFAARQLWSHYFPKRALPPDDRDGVHEMIALVLREISHDHGTADHLGRDAQATIAGIKNFVVANNIIRLPDPDHLTVIEMPEFQRGNTIADLSCAPPLDPDATSIYAISPPPKDWDQERVEGFLEEYNSRMLQMLSIHEAYPGHNVQLNRANRLPSLIRKVLGSGVYMEGWAVYCEQMMLDQGYGAGDLALRLVHLKYDLRSSANALLDQGMHSGTMSDEEAMSLLMDDAFQTKGEATLKVIRAKQGSCQLSTYFVGHRAFETLRRQMQRELGDHFDLLRFHEAIIAQGSVPIKFLPELVRRALISG